MKSLYSYFLITEYNVRFNSNILLDCSCYEIYAKLKENVFDAKRSYTCCLLLNDRVTHLTLPIMLGSIVDFSIREKTAGSLEFDHSLLGGFIIDGSLKVIPNFITNNLSGGHIYVSKLARSFRMNLALPEQTDRYARVNYTEGSQQVQLQLHNSGEASFTSNYTLSENICSKYMLEMLSNSQFDSEVDFNASNLDNYRDYFNTFIDNGPEIDDLSNKVVITPATLLHRAITILSKKAQPKLLLPRLKHALSTGNMHFVLSSKPLSRSNIDSNSLYVNVEGHKIKDVSLMVSMVKRYNCSASFTPSTAAASGSASPFGASTQNPKALLFPADGHHFLCPLTTKEMKSAGETLYLSNGVVISQELEKGERESRLVKLLERLCSQPVTGAVACRLQVVLDGFLTRWVIRSDDTFAQLRKLKRKFPLSLTLMNFEDRYLVLSTTGGVPIKYSSKYRIYVSPYEAAHIFKNAFADDDPSLRFSCYSSQLNLNFDKLVPEKATVSINNIQGSCNTFTSPFNKTAFSSTSGYNSALIFQANPIAAKGQHTHLVGAPPPVLKLLFEKLISDRHKGFTELSRQRKQRQADALRKHEKRLRKTFLLSPEQKELCTKDMPIFAQLLNATRYLSGFSDVRKTANSKVVTATFASWFEQAYRPRLFETRTLDDVSPTSSSSSSSTLVLNVAFGDLAGGTVEDGIVVDSRLSCSIQECKAKKLVSVYLTVKFSEENKSSSSSSRRRGKRARKLLATYYPSSATTTERATVIFGVLVSETPLLAKKSKNICVQHSYVSNHHRYLIFVNDLTDIPKTFTSSWDADISSVLISYEHYLPITAGTKLSNSHGQKCIVSRVADLKREEFAGYKADGTIVYPELLFSPQSIVGRTTASQVFDMLTSEDVAFTRYGGVISPLPFSVHHLDSATQCKLSSPKNDLMTNENGFLSNQMSNLSYCLSTQKSSNCLGDAFHFLQQLFVTTGSRIDLCT